MINSYRFLDKLKEKMLLHLHEKYNVGALVLDKRGNILTYGYNSYSKTRPQMINKYYNEFQIWTHAECDSLSKLNRKQNPYYMIIARLDNKGNFNLAKPCQGCYSKIKESGLKQVFYTNKSGQLVILNLNITVENY